ncbi:MAG: hypothetical protein AMQ74_01463 [Candidatus Methanofastidiosum methylothiophilum]|uniref:Uncharacterized protein n=1 Tax=Candidatus Methanofastidiosum methylothiophilum TaxID=1705564 RepID=A0A150IWF0_9EURY|nr:MAG: hypothetical protein AMQ74_01463 [Candidatus Methanofastidiosum methylthiophilus]
MSYIDTPYFYRGDLMRDYTNEKNPYIKPFVYKNDSRLHFNWVRAIETIGISVFTALIIFVGARFGTFEKAVVKQDIARIESQKMQCDIEEMKKSIIELQTNQKKNIADVEKINSNLEKIITRQMDYFLLTQKGRQQDINELKKSFKR